MSDVEVVHHADNRFYELLVDGQFAGLVVYEAADGRYVFTHTFVAEGYRGRGLSQVLIRGVLDDVQARQVTATNRCPIMDRFVQNNPEYSPLINTGKPAARE